MDFVRVELHGNKQTVRIGSLHKSEYDLAKTDTSEFHCRTALGETRHLDDCDDVARYSGIQSDKGPLIVISEMTLHEAEPRQGRRVWRGAATEALSKTKTVLPTPSWWAPIEQRQYRAWYSHVAPVGFDFYDVEVHPQDFAIEKLTGLVSVAYDRPVYSGVLYDGKPLKRILSTTSNMGVITWTVDKLDTSTLIKEETKLERLGLLTGVERRSIPDLRPSWKGNPLIKELLLQLCSETYPAPAAATKSFTQPELPD